MKDMNIVVQFIKIQRNPLLLALRPLLFTGTAGFIGYHLARRLIKRGDEVVGIDNINDYYDVKGILNKN
jgi:hypothetical protein